MRILIVEDEYYLAADLAEALAARGAEILGPIGTLDEALQAIAADRPDQAVLDVNLRGEMISRSPTRSKPPASPMSSPPAIAGKPCPSGSAASPGSRNRSGPSASRSCCSRPERFEPAPATGKSRQKQQPERPLCCCRLDSKPCYGGAPRGRLSQA
jgi:hypothetical protein